MGLDGLVLDEAGQLRPDASTWLGAVLGEVSVPGEAATVAAA